MIKSERSAKIQMGKLDRAHAAAARASQRFSFDWTARNSDANYYEKLEALRAEVGAAYARCEAFEAEAKAAGFRVYSKVVAWAESPTRALIAANID